MFKSHLCWSNDDTKCHYLQIESRHVPKRDLYRTCLVHRGLSWPWCRFLFLPGINMVFNNTLCSRICYTSLPQEFDLICPKSNNDFVLGVDVSLRVHINHAHPRVFYVVLWVVSWLDQLGPYPEFGRCAMLFRSNTSSSPVLSTMCMSVLSASSSEKCVPSSQHMQGSHVQSRKPIMCWRLEETSWIYYHNLYEWRASCFGPSKYE